MADTRSYDHSSSEADDDFVLYQRLNKNGRPVGNETIQIPHNEISRFRRVQNFPSQSRPSTTATRRSHAPDNSSKPSSTGQRKSTRPAPPPKAADTSDSSTTSDSDDDQHKQGTNHSRVNGEKGNGERVPPGPQPADIGNTVKRLVDLAMKQSKQPTNSASGGQQGGGNGQPQVVNNSPELAQMVCQLVSLALGQAGQAQGQQQNPGR